MRQELRFALRQLIQTPGFTIIAIATLALGIGANTSMFSVLNSLMFRPLPYADPAHLDAIYRQTPQNPRGSISPADFYDLRGAADGYGEIAAYSVETASLSERGQPAEMAPASRVTA